MKSQLPLWKMYFKKKKTCNYEVSSLVLIFAKDDSPQQQGTPNHILMGKQHSYVQ